MMSDLLGTVDFLGDFLLLVFAIMGIKYYVIEPWWDGQIKLMRETFAAKREFDEPRRPKK